MFRSPRVVQHPLHRKKVRVQNLAHPPNFASSDQMLQACLLFVDKFFLSIPKRVERRKNFRDGRRVGFRGIEGFSFQFILYGQVI